MTVLLNVEIPGEPIAQERHRWGSYKRRPGGHHYDPNAEDKKNIGWQFTAACPRPQMSRARLAVIVEVWTAKKQVEILERIPGIKEKKRTGRFRYTTDWDNYGKFYCDAISDWGRLWENDSQIDDGRVIVHRQSSPPKVKILVYELPPA